MTLTAETLTRHELVGLDVSVVAASNPEVVGLAGEAVAETRQMLGIETDGSVVQVPKADVTFEWTVPSDGRVRTDGEQLVGRPARRTERRRDSIWR